MKVSKAVAGLVSATVLFGFAPAVLADEAGFLARLRQALGKGHTNKANDPHYDLYGGYTPEEKVYSYPPYGYHPPPPPPPPSSTTSASDEPVTTTSRDRCVWIKYHNSSPDATPYYELSKLNGPCELRQFSDESNSS
ncbi:unnamed protein product [Sordaria macrospora k-hell]|uniref:WGS project CABT00000000 data, contig 2.6 n=1 Tax=Sordaria macrospora (strain ATCC MYA-333 / DSM 997 / K(L3346) / K-hell) TaxID=771870 RepID=F7VSX4_SORMK|nr:uncharacterized protein SMAC_05431 [Sordaria macrospora k-hell]KAH7628475.1 hypothetical protein B0T09DRAFT_266813 [Sordaria sp. MPI-SDFR-AT-0083]CCC08791.1 unnamed protein product [Sordaria macrospora k-hell]